MLDSATKTVDKDFLKTADSRRKILVLFGTRPEAIKLAPVIHELEKKLFQTIVVSSSQHKELLKPFLTTLDIKTDFDLSVMRKDQTPNEVCSKILLKLDKILKTEQPDLILVQGDTTTTLAGSLAGFNRKIPVGHIEAGLAFGKYSQPVSRRNEPAARFSDRLVSFCRDGKKPAQSFGGKRFERENFRHRQYGC